MLIVDLHKVYDSMRDLIRRVRHSARDLANTSAEVSRASLDLSQRTEDAASNLGVQAAAVQLINDQINQSAQRTQEAAVMAGGNADVAQKGGEIIGNVVNTMQGIRTSSSRISEIIGTIDGIAFQTNILALNAAVEAARAGESGRGFAVVASEVRSLAGRSAAAAREIKALIADSEEKVISGTAVVEAAGYNISEIVANAKQINLFLDEIAQATRNQAEEVAQVVGSIAQLDANTQQNFGWLQCQQTRYDEANRSFEQALANPMYSGRAKTLMAQGLCQARAGRNAEAERSLARSYELDAGNPVTAYTLSQLLFQRGDFTRAQFYIRRLNNSELANAQSLWLGIKVERRMNNRQAMEQLASQLRRRFPQSRELLAYERGAFDE